MPTTGTKLYTYHTDSAEWKPVYAELFTPEQRAHIIAAFDASMLMTPPFLALVAEVDAAARVEVASTVEEVAGELVTGLVIVATLLLTSVLVGTVRVGGGAVGREVVREVMVAESVDWLGKSEPVPVIEDSTELAIVLTLRGREGPEMLPVSVPV